jgi:hypothetical protein
MIRQVLSDVAHSPGQLLLLSALAIPAAAWAWRLLRRRPRPEVEPTEHVDPDPRISGEPVERVRARGIRARWLALQARWNALPRVAKVGVLVAGCVLVLFCAFLAGASITVLGFLATLLGLLVPFLVAPAVSNAR